LPTILELSGVSYPQTVNGENTRQIDGKSMLPLLFGEKEAIHDTLYWEHEGGRAIRIGDLKMTALPGKPWELYNLAENHTETNDLSGNYPEKVKMMDGAWNSWALRTGVKIMPHD